MQVRPRLLLHPGERMDAHDESSGDAGALFDAVLENPHGHEVHATAAGATFVLPPRCRVRVTRSPKAISHPKPLPSRFALLQLPVSGFTRLSSGKFSGH